MKRDLKTFTLIELIVVLSIIMILTTMLMTALRLVKDGSMSTQCANQLKQINTGLIMLTYDSNGYLPQHVNKPNGYWWFELVDGNTQNYSSLPAISDGYTKDKDLWTCPNDNMAFTGFHSNTLSYGYNYRNLGRHPDVKVKINQINSPSVVITVGDSKTTESYGKSRCIIEPSYAWNSLVSIRHKDGSNITFADGHSTWATFSDIDSSDWWTVK